MSTVRSSPSWQQWVSVCVLNAEHIQELEFIWSEDRVSSISAYVDLFIYLFIHLPLSLPVVLRDSTVDFSEIVSFSRGFGMKVLHVAKFWECTLQDKGSTCVDTVVQLNMFNIIRTILQLSVDWQVKIWAVQDFEIIIVTEASQCFSLPTIVICGPNGAGKTAMGMLYHAWTKVKTS